MSESRGLSQEVAKLYLKPGDRIADVTYGRGAFWQKLNTSEYALAASDLVTCPDAPYDCCDLPYDDETFNAVVLDPPYIEFSEAFLSPYEGSYRNRETTQGGHPEIMRLYQEGMQEACRVLCRGGLLMVKCKDYFHDKTRLQVRTHIDVFRHATETLGMCDEAMFVLVSAAMLVLQPVRRRPRQNQSYLWVFRKPKQPAKRRQ